MESDAQNPTAESSPATEQSPAEIDLSSLSPEQRQTWRETGEVPPKPSKEESTTSKQSPEAASEDQAEKTSAAPEAGKESQERKDSKPKPRSNAESRIKELLAENKRALANNKRLEAELAEVRRPRETKSAESSPAKVEPKPAESKALEAPKKPKYEDFQTFEEYEAAKDKYFEELTDYKSKKAVEDFQRNQTQQAQQKVINEQVTEARKLYTDFDDKAGPVLKAVFEDAGIHQAVKEAINRSPVLPHLLYAIGGKGELAKLVEAAKTDPLDAIRQINIYEYLVMQELEKPGKGNGKAQESEEEESPAQTVTRVPKPPSEVGGRATSTEDPGVAAARANDFRGAKAEWDRRAREGRIH